MYLFIMGERGSTQEAELSDYRDASMYSKEHLDNSYLQKGPPTVTHTQRYPEGHGPVHLVWFG